MSARLFLIMLVASCCVIGALAKFAEMDSSQDLCQVCTVNIERLQTALQREAESFKGLICKHVAQEQHQECGTYFNQLTEFFLQAAPHKFCRAVRLC